MKKTASISARISPETKERLQAHAEATDQTSSQLLEKAINHYLDEIQNVTQNVMQDETHDVTQNVRQTETPETSALENRLEALEFELKKLRLDANGNADKLNQLDKDAVKIPDMEGISCALYQDSLRDRVEALETTQNNETPTDLSIDGDSDPTKRSSESEEKPIPQLEDKIRQHTPIEESAIAQTLPDTLSYPKLAKAYGISRNTLANWVNGNTIPRGEAKDGRDKKVVWGEIKANWELGKDGQWHKR